MFGRHRSDIYTSFDLGTDGRFLALIFYARMCIYLISPAWSTLAGLAATKYDELQMPQLYICG